jgi:Protein of unknown function (DUF3035)
MISKSILLMAASAMLVSGCSSLTGGKKAPDEFAVTKEAPLVMPPDFALRPPRPGAPRPTELGAQGQALEALFGQGTALPQRSAGEQALLDRAGANKAAPDIRSTVRDDGTIVADKGVFLKEILTTQSGVKTIDGVDIQPGDKVARKKK